MLRYCLRVIPRVSFVVLSYSRCAGDVRPVPGRIWILVMLRVSVVLVMRRQRCCSSRRRRHDAESGASVACYCVDVSNCGLE